MPFTYLARRACVKINLLVPFLSAATQHPLNVPVNSYQS
jgi:hypothetical protein